MVFEDKTEPTNAVIKFCFVLEDYYLPPRHWILQDCEKFSFTKKKK